MLVLFVCVYDFNSLSCQSVLSLPSSRLYVAAAGTDGLFVCCFADTTTIPCSRLLRMMVVSLCGSRLPCVAGNAMFAVWPLAPGRPRASTVWCGRVLADDAGRVLKMMLD